jgi:hypothetical protein
MNINANIHVTVVLYDPIFKVYFQKKFFHRGNTTMKFVVQMTGDRYLYVNLGHGPPRVVRVLLE